jgi:hypothetical protein
MTVIDCLRSGKAIRLEEGFLRCNALLENSNQVCNKIVQDRKWYIHYEGVHLLGRDFPCDRCNKTFKRKQHLVKHVSAVHPSLELANGGQSVRPMKEFVFNNEFQPPKKDSLFSCKLCGQRYSYTHHLEKHLQHHQQNIAAFDCLRDGRAQLVERKMYLCLSLNDHGEQCNKIIKH